jgi:hypothetical protein
MADDTNNELATLLAADMPVSPAERELAHRNRKLRQPVQPADDTGIVDPRLVSMLANGGIGSDANFPVGPAIRPMVSNPAYSLGGKRMEGQRPLTDTELSMPRAAAELTGVPQAVDAIGEAYTDPTLTNVVNAGSRTAMAAMRPVAAAKILGAGYTAAAAKQSGLLDTEAEAQSKKGAAPKEVMPGLSTEQQSEYNAAKRRLESGDYDPAERSILQETMREFQRQSRNFTNANADKDRELKARAETSKQDEYNRQVKASEDAFNEEMSRNKRFDKTPVGEMYEKTGGYAPFLAGILAGGTLRTGAGPGSIGTKYIAPTIIGGAAGAFAPNAPSYYNSTNTPPDNPKKRAYEARAEALPPEHPRRQEYLDYANSLPELNPVREAALKDFTAENILKRSGMGAAEGALGGLMGADTINALGRTGSATGSVLKSIAGVPGRVLDRLGLRQGIPAQSSGAVADVASEANALAPRPTAEPTSSAEILPPSALRQSLADRVRAPSPLPETDPNLQLARVLAQDQLPSPSTPSSSDLVRALASPANGNVPKSAQVKRGKDSLGRPYAKDPDDGRFTSDPDK